MIQVKFRAWDKKLKVWTIEFTLKDVASGTLFTTEDFNDFEVVQFTGLLDKNGNEIYEGDVIKVRYWKDNNAHGVVEYDKIYCAYGIKTIPNQMEMGFGDFQEIEIVGNIYKKPELLI